MTTAGGVFSHAQAGATTGPPLAGHLDDAVLTGWIEAAGKGTLPEPGRSRWQPLRAGVVNLWEFDNAEFWYADGKAQFIGANQSGKSTLLTLTSLIHLAASIDRNLIDTFGTQHKAFRYYVEPTTEATDRRDTDQSLNRGWSWIEYGRLGEDGPCYFTTLLYAQARRGAQMPSPTWAYAYGKVRVRAGIALRVGQAVAQPADLPDNSRAVSDFGQVRVCSNAGEYRKALCQTLLGFSTAERLDSVVRMLKILRTPQLGRSVDPSWFTAQMRQALPALDETEVTQLADAWEELDRLAADRDSARDAHDAVVAYLKSAWRPWADARLRLAADELVTADHRLSSVSQAAGTAKETLQRAEERDADLGRQLSEAKAAHEQYVTRRDQIRESAEYRDAHAATQNARALGARATEVEKRAAEAEQDLTEADDEARDAKADVAGYADGADTAANVRQAAVLRASGCAAAAGLGEKASQWALDGDTDRLAQAARQRAQTISWARGLLQEQEGAENVWRTSTEILTRDEQAVGERSTDSEAAGNELESSIQDLSDSLETWAIALGEDAPDITVRGTWISTVADQSRLERPAPILGSAIRDQWLTPLTEPMRTKINTMDLNRERLIGEAEDFERKALEAQARTDPKPSEPPYWVRRTRPAPSGGGAELWRLLDPNIEYAEGSPVLDHVEAALAAAGLLETWITPDGTWQPERDGNDAVLAGDLLAIAQVSGVARLSHVLRPAEDAGPLAALVKALLERIAFVAGQQLTDAPYAVGADGWWRTPFTTGRAQPPTHGATLLGTAARAAARDREITEHQECAANARQAAGLAGEQARELGTRLRRLENAVDTLQGAPDDVDVMYWALALRTADGELAAAQARCAGQQKKVDLAQRAVGTASAVLLTYGVSIISR